MTRSNLRIPCITTAVLVLGGSACADTKGDGSSGVDASNARVRAVARSVCQSEQRCEPEDFAESHASLDDCVQERLLEFPLAGQSGEDVRKCQDAILDLATCYSAAACNEGDDACADLYETYADLCARFDTSEEEPASSFAKQPARRFRIPR